MIPVIGAVLLLILAPGFVPVPQAVADEPIQGAGDVLQWLIPATGFGATYAYDDSEGRWQFVPSMLTALAVTYGLKYAVDEQRPNGGSHSFPSGHTSSAFQGATFLQQRYGWKWGIPAYAAAVYTGWSRVELHAHYPHDVYAGAAIGILSSCIFTTRYHKDVQVAAFAEDGAVGIQIGVAW
ncbi:MAG: phosphatase PAP2 family protein [bacterium]